MPLLLWALAAAGGCSAPDVLRPADVAGMAHIPVEEVDLGSDDEERAYGYQIGGEAARRARWFDREQEREVELPAFRIDLAPVTQAAYGEFVRQTGHRVPYITEEAYREQGYLVHPYDAVIPYLWFSNQPPADRRDHPVVLVSQDDAQTYCRWRGQRIGAMCQLPTEDQWELAARGTDGRYFPWGDEWDPARANTAQRGPMSTTPVTRYPQGRSPYGLVDMAGNVFEWTLTPGSAERAVLKSCSWDDLGGICRAAARHERWVRARHILIGFRCACNPAEDE